MVQRPSLIRIVTNDWPAFLGGLVPLVVWPVFLILVILDEGRVPGGLILGLLVALSLAGLGVVLWRVQLFLTVFADDQRAAATVTAVWFYRDRGRIEYSYTYQGQKIQSGNAVHKTKHSAAYRPGDQVVVVVDRQRPQRAFIRELYSPAAT